MDPIKIRSYPAYEVINLFVRLVEYNEKQKEKEGEKGPDEVVQINRRPAGDDWF